jgi:DNA-binding NtrC family response regulator
LLTSIEDRRIRRLGAVADLAVDVKVIAAVQAPLNQRVTQGHFRADLYHRLAVVILEIPPLRQRGDDVILLAQHFIDRHAAAHGVAAKRLGATAEQWLRTRQWAGNIRELNHLMERVVLLVPDHTIDADALQALGLPPVPLAGGPDVMREGGGSDAESGVGRTPSGKDEARIREGWESPRASRSVVSCCSNRSSFRRTSTCSRSHTSWASCVSTHSITSSLVRAKSGLCPSMSGTSAPSVGPLRAIGH